MGRFKDVGMSMTKTLALANAAAAVTAGSGFMAWVSNNAPALGIIFTGIMGLVSITFYVLTYLEKRRHHKAMEPNNDIKNKAK
jgi:hypothetical protein